VPILVVVSDGVGARLDAQAVGPAARTAALCIPAVAIDALPAEPRTSVLERLTQVLGGRLLRIGEPSAEAIAAAARTAAALAARDERWWPSRSRRGSR
jgi:Mg-chelatase subunit ChlD